MYFIYFIIFYYFIFTFYLFIFIIFKYFAIFLDMTSLQERIRSDEDSYFVDPYPFDIWIIGRVW